nr:hypothetical protein [Halapricum sp. CBA1109]
MATALARYNDLDADGRRAFQEVLQAGGDDVVEATAKLDGAVVDDVIRADASAIDRSLALRRAQLADDTAAVEEMLRGGDAADVRFVTKTEPRTLQQWLTPECAVGGGSARTTGGAASGSSGTGLSGCSYDAAFADIVSDTLDDTDINRNRFVRRYENDIEDKAAFRAATKDLDTADREEMLRITTEVNREYASNIGSGVADMRSSGAGDLADFFAFDAGDATQARASILRAVGDDKSKAADVTPERAYQFGTDAQDLADDPNVENVDAVITDDLTASGDDVFVNKDPNGVKGAMYEFRLAREKIDEGDIGTIELGKEIETPEFDGLDSDQIDGIIKDIDFEVGTRSESDLSRSRKKEIIRDALGPNSDGSSKSSEFDLLRGDDGYIEAKAGDIDREDIRNKLIRYKAHQLEGDLADGRSMKVVGQSGEFTYTGSDKLRKIGEFIKNSDGVTRETLDW